MIGHDLNHGHRPSSDVSGYDRHRGEVTQANPSEFDPHEQSSAGLDPAVEVPASSFDQMQDRS